MHNEHNIFGPQIKCKSISIHTFRKRWILWTNLRWVISGPHTKARSISMLTPSPSGFRQTYKDIANFNAGTKAQSADPHTKKRSVSIHTFDHCDFSASTKYDVYLDPVCKKIFSFDPDTSYNKSISIQMKNKKFSTPYTNVKSIPIPTLKSSQFWCPTLKSSNIRRPTEKPNQVRCSHQHQVNFCP